MHRFRHTRRAFVVAAGAGLLAPASRAQTGYPQRQVRVVVSYAAGGAIDLLARTLADRLGQRMGQPFVVENRPGAGGTLGVDAVAKSAPDGHTLLMGELGANAIAPAMYPRLPYAPEKDLQPVVLAVNQPMVLVVHPSVPATNLRELIEHARKSPSALNYASAGSGGISHLTGEMLNRQAGISIVHIPYKGGAPGLAAVVAGDVQLMLLSVTTSMPYLAQGRLRALAVTGRSRSGLLPDLPTMAESGLPQYVVESWAGFFGPAGLPREVVARLAAETQQVLREPQTRDKLLSMGFDPVGTGPEEFRQHVGNEIRRWDEIVRTSGAKLD